MVIIVTGTPGTGKTKVAKSIASRLKFKYIDINKIIKENKLVVGYDKKRNTNIVDDKKLVKILVSMIKKNKKVVIDGHLSHYIPSRYVDLCIITRCDLKTLKKRLKKRGYSKEKIRENLDSEIFEIILNESLALKHKVFTIDTGIKNGLSSKAPFPF